MTAAMRAVGPPSGPRVLRIGVVRNGRILEERHLTTGALEPFARVGAHYYLNFVADMDARVALGTSIHETEALRSMARDAGDARRLRLTDDARGRIRLGATTLLFQFVLRPPVQPRPQLPLAVKGGFFRQIDWDLTILAAFSFLLHFGLVGAFCSDWMDPVIDEGVAIRLVDTARVLPLPATETPREPTPAVPEEVSAPATATKSGGPKSGRGAPSRSDDGSSLAREADAMRMRIIGAFDGDTAVNRVLVRDDTPPIDLTPAAKAPMGTTGSEIRTGTNPIVRPGSPRGDLASLGNTRIGDRDGAGRDAPTTGPSRGDARIEPPSVSGSVNDAERIVLALRPKFRTCYQRGLSTDPAMSGGVTIVAKVAPNGEVSEAEPSAASGLSPSVIACIQRVVRNAQFAAPGGAGGTIRIPVKFVQQPRSAP